MTYDAAAATNSTREIRHWIFTLPFVRRYDGMVVGRMILFKGGANEIAPALRRTACCKGRDAVKAELGEIQPIDKGIDRPHRIVLAHIVIQNRGKQRALSRSVPSTKRFIRSPANREES
jgi:hypothetical protein